MKSLIHLTSLCAIAVVILIMGIQNATVQQTYCAEIDDPQVQIAFDMDCRLKQGKCSNNSLEEEPVNLTYSLIPFTVLYNANKQPITIFSLFI